MSLLNSQMFKNINGEIIPTFDPTVPLQLFSVAKDFFQAATEICFLAHYDLSIGSPRNMYTDAARRGCDQLLEQCLRPQGECAQNNPRTGKKGNVKCFKIIVSHIYFSSAKAEKAFKEIQDKI